MKILMVAAGEKPRKDILNEYLNYCDVTIAIDKGTEIFLENGISPDYAVGDFDSISEKFKVKLKDINNFVYPSEKDFTDSDIAVNLAFKLKATEIVMLGMTGGRIDHLFGNIGLLNKCLKNGVSAYIVDGNNKVFLKDKSFNLQGKYGDIVSFYAFSGDVENLKIENAKYPLDNYLLEPFESLCNSNEFLDGDIEVSFDTGKLLVIYSKE
ncbi:thiamine diphosphokinase [uncultured Clostridium sp.]|jgi:thiamine pyrophosphokinase|uniref:thiamine diphosphokinase n=1 Tax=uncultured Clostridium sp. TaxID=59620 RepID=UPI002611D93D|nr:thiamine diphosphokinase [uncultured Clostridium sp.]